MDTKIKQKREEVRLKKKEAARLERLTHRRQLRLKKIISGQQIKKS